MGPETESSPQIQTDPYADLKEAYRSEDGIVAFVHDILGASPAPYQEDILRMFVRHRRLAVRGPHGLGKTAIASWVVLWGMAVFDEVKIPCTASVWRQLRDYLFPEIKKWARRGRWTLLGIQMRDKRELLDLSIKLTGDRLAFALASDNAALIEGAHSKILIYIFDEAKAIPPDIWDAAEGAFSNDGEDGAMAFALAISTPGDTSGRFYDIHKRKPGYQDWAVRHVTLEETIRAGRISQAWADQRALQWGRTSSLYLRRVLGEFDESGSDTLIPLTWIELSHERWHACEGKGEGASAIGGDIARFGEDRTALAKLVGRVVESLEYYSKEDTMQTSGRIVMLASSIYQAIGIDSIGIGAGVVDRLRELGYENTLAINGSEGTSLTDASGEMKFINLRAALWWLLREALDPNNEQALAIPPDADLEAGLAAPKWSVTSTGKIKIEAKDEIKKRLGFSPDGAEAVMYALYAAMIPQVEHVTQMIVEQYRDSYSNDRTLRNW